MVTGAGIPLWANKVRELTEEDEANRYREASDEKLRRLIATPLVQLGPDTPAPVPERRPGWRINPKGIETPRGEQPSTAAPVEEASLDDPNRDYTDLGPSPTLSQADIEGDPIPAGYAREGVGGPPGGEVTDAQIIDILKKREERQGPDPKVRGQLLQAPNPDEAAKAIDLAQRNGVNRLEVEQNRATFEAVDRAKEIDRLRQSAPKLRSWMDADPANLEVAHDDAEHLGWWEQATGALERVAGAVHSLDKLSQSAPRSVFTPKGAVAAREVAEMGGKLGEAGKSGLVRSSSGIYGALRFTFDLNDQFVGAVTGKPQSSGPAQFFARLQAEAQQQADMLMPKSDDPTERGVLSAAQSVPVSATAAIFALLGRPDIGLSMMGVTTGGDAYGEARAQGLDATSSAGYGLGQGLIEVGTELLPMKWLVGDTLKRTPFFEMLSRQALAEGVTEQVATHSQDFLSWAVLPENADKPISAYIAERGPAAYETLVASLVGSGVQTTLAKTVDESLRTLDESYQQRRSEELAKTFDAMAEGAASSKLLKRLPDKYRDLVAQVTKDGPLESVRIQPEAFNELAQSAGVTTEQLAQAFRIDPNDIVSAVESGEDVVIPSGNYAAALSTAKKEIGISGEQIHAAFAPNMRLRADDFTAKEREAMKAVFEEEQKARAESGTKEQSFADSADRVRETIREQVAGLKIFNTEAANTQAAIVGEMVTTLAERTGQDPETLWKEQGFDIVTSLTSDPADDALSQSMVRQPVETNEIELNWASQDLTPRQFEVWKGAREGLSNEQIAERINEGEPDAVVSPEAVKVALTQARALGYDAQKTSWNDRGLAPETQRIINLKARGVANKDIAEAVFRDRETTKARNQVGVLVNRHKALIEARRQELTGGPKLAQGERGTFSPRADRSIIRLFESANLSTLAHEGAHWYLDTLWRMSQVESPHPFVLEQLAAILEWQGKSPNWTAMFDEQGRFTAEGRDIQEAFAESFEAYLREGKAPTTALRSVFASFKAWLSRIYRSISQIGSRVRLNDEIRQVFDRMLATEEAIKAATTGQARDSAAMAQALLKKGVITEKAVERTTARLAAAKERAEAEMMARLMEDYERSQKAWWRDEERQVRREVQSEIDERPEQRAYAWLSGKGWRDTREDQIAAAEAEADAMVALAQADGYLGTDIGEAFGWVMASRKGLPMDKKSRLERAEEQGFNTSEPMYHGSHTSFSAFKASATGAYGPGVYLGDPDVAGAFAGYSPWDDVDEAEIENGNIVPVFVRGKLYELTPEQAETINQMLDMSDESKGRELVENLKAQGYAGVINRENSFVNVFDPSNVRSINAAFDPDMTDSEDLLAQADGSMALEFLDAYVENPSQRSIERMQRKLLLEGKGGVVRLIRYGDKVIAFDGYNFTHDMAFSILGIDGRTAARALMERGDTLETVRWYDGAGESLAQMMPYGLKASAVKLNRAKQMKKAGQSDEAIWQATGWAQTLDGEWVYEIQGEPEWQPIVGAPGNKLGLLPDIIEWPELFDAMPQLRSVMVDLKNGKQGGSFSDVLPVSFTDGTTRDMMVIEVRGTFGSDAMMETLRHEIQHAIQFLGQMRSTGASATVSIYRDMPEFQREVAHVRAMELKYNAQTTAPQAMLSDEDVEATAAYRLYLRNRGETGARDIEERSRWTPEQRKLLPPYSKSDGTRPAFYNRTWATYDELRADNFGQTQTVPDGTEPEAVDGDRVPNWIRQSHSADQQLAPERAAESDGAAATGRARNLAQSVNEAGRSLAQSEWSESGYARVMPRDLFNEAKVLSMHLKLIEDYNAGRLPKGFEISVNGDGIDVRLTENGDLYLANVTVSFNGTPVDMQVSYNAGKNVRFPLHATAQDMDAWSVTVYDDNGSLDTEFTDTFGSELATPDTSADVDSIWADAKTFMNQLGVVGLWDVDGKLPRNFTFDLADPERGFQIADEGGRLVAENVVASIGAQDVQFFMGADNVLMFESGDVSGPVLSGPRAMSGEFRKLLDDLGGGEGLSQRADRKDRTAPPAGLPPMRLNLQAVREQYGDQALAEIPPEVAAYSAQATDVDQFLEVARDVRKTLKQKRPKTLWKFLSTSRVIGSGNDKISFRGIRDDGGEILKIIGEKKAAPGLISDKEDAKRVRSYTVEHAANVAWEEGYFNGPNPPTPAEFLDALRADFDGQAPLYARADVAVIQQIKSAEQWEQWFDQNGIDISESPETLKPKLETLLTSQTENAIGPDEAAPFFGMPDGNALLQGLKEGPKRNEMIRKETQRRMIERHGDPFKDGTIMREAETFARNEVQQRQLEIELEALSKAAGQFAASNLAKQTAIENLRSKQVREVLNYNQWLTLEQRWGKKALEAAEKGKFDDAARYKKFQLLNMHMFREGRKLAEEIEKGRKFILSFEGKDKRIKVARAGQDYLDQIDQILEGYEFRPRTNKALAERQSLAAWFAEKSAAIDPLRDSAGMTPEERMAQQQEEIERSDALASMQRDAALRNYKSLDAQEFFAVRDQVDMIARLARQSGSLLEENERRSLQLTIDDIVARIVSAQPKKRPPESLASFSPKEAKKRGWNEYFAELRTLQSLIRQIDGEDNGPLARHILYKLNAAFGRRLARMRTEEDAVVKLYRDAYGSDLSALRKNPIRIPGVEVPLAKMERLTVALNMGTEINRKRLMDGYGWDSGALQAIINTLDETDWAFVRSVWNYVNSLYPEANEAHLAVHGVPLTKQAGIPVVTRFGVIDGSYWPLKYNPHQSSRAAQQALQEEAKQITGRAGTRKTAGFTKERVKGKVTLPVLLDLSVVLPQHVDEVVASITTQKALLDAGRIIVARDVERAIVDHHGRIAYKQVLNALRDARNGPENAKNQTERILIRLRHGATMVGLGLNLGTVAKQLIGVTNSSVRLAGKNFGAVGGMAWVLKGTYRMGIGAQGLQNGLKFISDRSDYMRTRMLTQSREIADQQRRINEGRVKGELQRFIQVSSMWLIQRVQYLGVDAPLWLGAYEKAIASGLDEATAAAGADQMVIDAQGSGEIYQIAGIQRGSPLLKLMTNFMTTAVATWNLGVNRTRETNFRNPWQAAIWSLNMTVLMSVPVVMTMLVEAALRAGDGGDDDEPLEEQFIRSQISFLLSSMGLFGQLGSAVEGYTYKGPQGTRAFAEASKAIEAAGKDIERLFAGEEMTGDAIRPLNLAAGMWFGYPAAALDRFIRGADAMMKGETSDPRALVTGPPRN